VIDAINRSGVALPQVCYHPQLGPSRLAIPASSKVNGELVGACATTVADNMKVSTAGPLCSLNELREPVAFPSSVVRAERAMRHYST
jgi:predicted molibdopterin-dependent oxidoreductase YjgC